MLAFSETGAVGGFELPSVGPLEEQEMTLTT